MTPTAHLIRSAVRPRVLSLAIELAIHEATNVCCTRCEIKRALALHRVIHPTASARRSYQTECTYTTKGLGFGFAGNGEAWLGRRVGVWRWL